MSQVFQSITDGGDASIKVLSAFTLATVSAVAALILTLLIPPLHQQFKFLLFTFAVLVSATRGIWPGVFATLLSAALALGFIIQPLRSPPNFHGADIVRLVLFSGVGLLITWITRRLHHLDQSVLAAAAMVDSSADSIMRQGLDNTILSWNKAAEHIYGYTSSEAIGSPVSIIVPADRRGELQRLVERVQMGGSVQGHETVRMKKDGKLIDIALTLSPVQDRKRRVVGVSSIARDITERKHADEWLRQSHTQLERQTHQLRLLAEMAEMIQASSIPAEAYAVTAQFVQALIPGCAGALFVHPTSKDNLEAVRRWGDPRPNDPDSLLADECWGLRTGRVHVVDDSQRALLCRHLPSPAPLYYLCVPMIAHGETLGLLHLRMTRENHASPEAAVPGSLDLNWPVRVMAERLALRISDMRLREELRAQSICDPLTGWYNRRHMEETLDRDIRRASRTRQPLSLLIFDIDNFKEFNDSFGHEAGDVTLQNLCQIVKTLIRNEDVACRYGGDEYVLILPDTASELAAERAEEIRAAVKKADLQYQGYLLKPLTLSFGVATFPADGRSSRELLRAADTALFRAKSEGRNRVRMHGKPSQPAAEN